MLRELISSCQLRSIWSTSQWREKCNLWKYNCSDILCRSLNQLYILSRDYRFISSWCFVDEEWDFTLLKGKIHKTISFMDSVATKTLAKEYVPVWFPSVIHIFLNDSCNLKQRDQYLMGCDEIYLPQLLRFQNRGHLVPSLQ